MWEAIAGMVGAGISAAGSLLGTKMHNDAQRRESELAYQRERAAIKEQNAYNSASAQLARLQAAGLNPNLMYENSQEAAAGTQSDIAHYQPAEIDNAFEPMGNAGQQMINSLIGLKDMENKTALAQAKILLDTATTHFTYKNAELTANQNHRLLALLDWDIKNAEASFKNLDADTQKKLQEAKNLAADYDLIVAKTGLTKEQVSNLDAQTRYTLARLPYAADFAKMEVAEKRALIQKIATEISYMNESLEIQQFNKWVNMGDVIAKNVIGAAGVTSRFLGKGASLQDVFGSDPWSMMQGKGAFTKGFNLNDSANPFGQFLPGD